MIRRLAVKAIAVSLMTDLALSQVRTGDMLRSKASGTAGRVIIIRPPLPDIDGPGSVVIATCNGELNIGGPPHAFERWSQE